MSESISLFQALEVRHEPEENKELTADESKHEAYCCIILSMYYHVWKCCACYLHLLSPLFHDVMNKPTPTKQKPFWDPGVDLDLICASDRITLSLQDS